MAFTRTLGASVRASARVMYTTPAFEIPCGMYAGHVSQALSIAAQCPGGAYYTKWIIGVEEDIDPTDMNEVLWAMSSRCNPPSTAISGMHRPDA